VGIYILDASAILHARNAEFLKNLGTLYTTDLVIEELRDPRASAMPEILGINIIHVDHDDLVRIRRRYGLGHDLSDADVSLIVLALDMRNEDPIVVTDDALLVRKLRGLGIRVRPIFLRRKI